MQIPSRAIDFIELCRLTPSIVLVLGAVMAAAGESSNVGEANARRASGERVPSVEEMIASRTDVWGEAARRQPNGASYEFFKDLLPPLRWVNTDFRHYPLVLSAPRSPHKVRLVSNGSAVHARANKPPMWYELGVPVAFFVGQAPEPFGEYLSQLDGPAYLDGYLPIVSFMYRAQGAVYREEVFALVDQSGADQGTAMLRFSVTGGGGRVEARIDSDASLHIRNGEVLQAEGKSLAAFSPAWTWDADRKALTAQLSGGQTAELAIFTRPAEPGRTLTAESFDRQKQECVEEWRELLDRGTKLLTPEPIVNDAWPAMLIGNFMLAAGDRLHYSAGNAYAKLYESECGDTLRSMMVFGQLDAAPAFLKPLLKFDREATRFHVAGHKLQLLAFYYWLTRDSDTIRANESLWRPSVELILASREPKSGLLPKDNYAGDIPQKVYSLNSNASCWRGLRDVAAMLDDMGERDEARKLWRAADELRLAILDAVARSERRDAQPTFIPVALLADEPAHDPLTATRQGSYYNLICPYVIGSEIFGQGSEREDWLLGYLQNHGAIAMGMIRTTPHQGQFDGEPGVNPLYGLRYQLALLRRDEREKALVGFYGQLAQGMTRDTFIGGEGSRFLHGDANGRSFYLPPNSSSNAAWLVTLRNLLIQDWDLDEDGRPETLRLLFAAPRKWLDDGQRIHIENAPTQFGLVSFDVESKLSEGGVVVHVKPPPLAPKAVLLRAPLPVGWQIKSVEVEGVAAALIDGDTVELSGRTEPLAVEFAVKKKP
jgi:hypothetical protein